jgi:hypothetical protein
MTANRQNCFRNFMNPKESSAEKNRGFDPLTVHGADFEGLMKIKAAL